ncbi:MAG: hypothetical protein ACLRSA_06210 [Streptococcus salivarius]
MASIAMESGNDATKKMAQVVLPDSDFGRCRPSWQKGELVNNIQRSASLLDQEYLFHFVGHLSDALSLYLSHHAVADVFDQWFYDWGFQDSS